METRLGLRDVIAGETHICKLDEQESKVYYFGYSIEELVEREGFESVAYLTLFGELPAGKGFAFARPGRIPRCSSPSTRFWLVGGPVRAGVRRTAMSSL